MMSSLQAHPAKFSYKCCTCGEMIIAGTQQLYDKERPKGERNVHVNCGFKDQKQEKPSSATQQETPASDWKKASEEINTQPNSKMLEMIRTVKAQLQNNPEFDEQMNSLRISSAVYTTCVEIVKEVVMEQLTISGDFTPIELGVTKSQICDRFVTKEVVFTITQQILAILKNPSAEISDKAYSSGACNRGATTSIMSLAVKDGLGFEQGANPATSFFYNKRLRFVPKCVRHGTVCNETTGECKMCVEQMFWGVEDFVWK